MLDSMIGISSCEQKNNIREEESPTPSTGLLRELLKPSHNGKPITALP